MYDNPSIEPPVFGWLIRFEHYDPKDEGRREAVLALGNGMLVARASVIDTRLHAFHYPGTYHAGCYNKLAAIIADHCDHTESLVRLPNWLPLACRMADGTPLSLDHAQPLHYSHQLDMHSGSASRDYVLLDEQGRRTRLRETCFVSMANPHLTALRLQLTPLNWSGDIELLSMLDGDVANTNVRRYADYPNRHLLPCERSVQPDGCMLLQMQTSQSHIKVAQAARTSIDLPHEAESAAEQYMVCQRYRLTLQREQNLTVDKLVAHCSSLDAADLDTAQAALDELRRAPSFSNLRDGHEQAWQELWRRTGIAVCDETIARPLRFHAFHILQTVSPHIATLDAGIPARGWHGEAYHGHIFWDELFVFPFLIFRFPETAKACLMYRYRRLDAARASARRAGYRGAMYPWRSAGDGLEATPAHQKNLLSGAWMEDHTYLQRHVGAAIVYNIWHYVMTTGDEQFLADYGAEMMLDIARFWSSIAVPRDKDGRFQVCGVIGPDEYHNAYPWRNRPGLDNNAYTNVMAAWTLCRALDLRERLPAARWQSLCEGLQIDETELARWDLLSRRMFVPFHDGLINQYEGFEKLQAFDIEMLPTDMRDKRLDWALHAMGRNADEFQITKQADALTLLYLFPKEEVARLFARLGYQCSDECILHTARYYLARTVHRSSLSRVVYAGALAQVAPEMSWEFYQHVLETDLDPLKGESVAEGIHLGAMGGSIDILQRRYLGIEVCADGLSFAPCCPKELCRLRMTIQYRGQRIDVENLPKGLRVFSHVGNRAAITLVREGRHELLQAGAETWIPYRTISHAA
jgi:trehalose/maltose hydrolase-like predicted phosphorylase